MTNVSLLQYPDKNNVLLVSSLLVVKDKEECVDIELLERNGVLKQSRRWCLRIVRWRWIWVLGCLGPIIIIKINRNVRVHGLYMRALSAGDEWGVSMNERATFQCRLVRE